MEMANKNAVFSSVACRIEPSVRAVSESASTESIPIFDHDEVPPGFETLSNLSVEVVYCAWAIVLRSYVFNETVSFGLLSSSRDEGAGRIRKIHDVSAEVEDARICQYQAISERQWGEWLPDAYQDTTKKGFEETQINTAVCLWGAERSFRPQPLGKHVGRDLAQFLDLVLNVGSSDWPQNLSLQYCSSRFHAPYAQSIARTFQTVLTELARKDVQTLGGIDPVSKQDKEKIRCWNARELYTNSSAMHHLIEVAASSKPEAEAICAWDGSMTFAELDVASSNVARQLIRAGICLGDMVPFAFEKSRWAVVTILAILKAGGAFVPLLPTHPMSRSEEIMASVGAKMVVTSARYNSLFAHLDMPTFEVSAETVYSKPAPGPDAVRFPNVGPDDLIFVLFTSGSTGKPKGVVHLHGPMSTHALCHGEAMGYHNARVIQFAAHVFDLSILDMTTTLIFGGCVCIPSEEDRLNNLPEVMNQMRVDLALLTPSVANVLRPDDITTLKTMICAGECYKEEIPRRWNGTIRLLVSYGPAETQFTHLRHVDRDDERTRPLSIGPLLDTAICMLVDPTNHDHLVPLGGVGEILVAATTLARGYLNDEDKTRAAFISNPAWSAQMGFQDMIFYKTGDLLRYNVGSLDGQYDFVGRKDTQIKIHGQRVEAGEIEYHLAGIRGLAASAVVFPSQGCFSGHLIAVVQIAGASSSSRVISEDISLDLRQHLSMDTVRTHLSKILPDYAIPSECLTIETMPLTTSGKVDRKTVEAWVASLESRPFGEEHVEAKCDISPLDETETTAHAISAAIAEMVASRDPEQGLQLQGNDFVLQSSGIDSIQVMSLSMFVRKTFGVKIALEHFQSSSSTVRRLAHLIDNDDEPVDQVIGDLDLQVEIHLHTEDLLDTIRPNSTGPEPQSVFVTGASGYLGAGILQTLLNRPGVDVYTLMRCSSPAEGLAIISRKAKAHGWWRASYTSRLHIWPGDLTKPQLGLSDEHLQYFQKPSSEQQLQQQPQQQRPCITAIIHNGARVHYNTDYHGLKATNLHPTKELLALLSSSPSLSTFIYVTGGRRHTFREDSTEYALLASRTNGYSQSKYVSESIVRACMSHSAFAAKNLHIIQPGYIMGSAADGIANLTDFIWRLVAGCLEIGGYNADESEHWLFISSVDRVAEAVTGPLFFGSSSSPSNNATTNNIGSGNHNTTNRILTGFPFSTLWSLLTHHFGYTLRPLSQTSWLSKLETAILATGPTHTLFPLLATIEKTLGHIGSDEEVPARHALEQENKHDSRVVEAAKANIAYLISIGFFVAPAEQRERVAMEEDGEECEAGGKAGAVKGQWGSETSISILSLGEGFGGRNRNGSSSAGTSPIELEVEGEGGK